MIDKIEFIKHLGIKQEGDLLTLEPKKELLNHIGSIHAGAIFTLAETQSGVYLQKLFPELKNKAGAVLRDAKIKYKLPAFEKVTAYASADKDAIEKFKTQFSKKGRGLLQIEVKIRDINNALCAQAVFVWFVKKL